MNYSFQVRRSEFDKILFDNAKAKGAEAIEDCRVTAVDFSDGGSVVTAAMADGETRQFKGASWLMQAGAIHSCIAPEAEAAQSPSRKRRRLRHFTGAERLQGARGAYQHLLVRQGLVLVHSAVGRHDERRRGFAAGHVQEPRRRHEALFQELIQSCPGLAHRLRDATLTGPATGTGNYSYAAETLSGPGYVMIGDAAGFIDPVFSTGVYLAMNSGFLAADAVETCLDRPEQAAAALKQFEETVKAASRAFRGSSTESRARDSQPVHGAAQLFPDRGGGAVAARGRCRSKIPIRSRLALFKALFYMKTGFGKVAGLVAPPAKTLPSPS